MKQLTIANQCIHSLIEHHFVLIQKIADPADESIIAHVPDCSDETLSLQIQQSELAFQNWKNAHPKIRADHLENWYSVIMQNESDLGNKTFFLPKYILIRYDIHILSSFLNLTNHHYC